MPSSTARSMPSAAYSHWLMFDTLDTAFFVSGVGTGVGKTFVSRALLRALQRGGRRAWGLKPLETGVDPDPLDALALARCSARPELAHAPGLYRVRPPLAPYAATLAGAPPPPSITELAQRIRTQLHGADIAIVEGAGGLLVPLDSEHTFAELAQELGYPLLLVAPDRLGVLSDTLACAEAAAARQLTVAAVILSQHAPSDDDPSVLTNARILAERIAAPVVRFPPCDDDDDALARAASHCGLLAALGLAPAPGP